MSYSGQLLNLMDEAKNILSTLVRKHGTESKFFSCNVLKVNSENFQFNLDSDRYLKEISEDELIDNHGYTYASDVLAVEDFLNLVDFYVNKFKKVETK